MSELLTTLASRYLRDREAFARAWNHPVLLFQPDPATAAAAAADPEEVRYRLQTASGVGVPTIAGTEPVVFPVRKTRENAFPRGVTLGRTRNNDVVLEDTSVSRFHAWIAQAPDGTWQLTDAGSRNGSSLDGESLQPKRAVPLHDGAQLVVGSVRLTFLLPEGLIALLRGSGLGGGRAGSLHTSGGLA